MAPVASLACPMSASLELRPNVPRFYCAAKMLSASEVGYPTDTSASVAIGVRWSLGPTSFTAHLTDTGGVAAPPFAGRLYVLRSCLVPRWWGKSGENPALCRNGVVEVGPSPNARPRWHLTSTSMGGAPLSLPREWRKEASKWSTRSRTHGPPHPQIERR